MQRRALLKTAASALALPGLALSQTRPVKIGQLTDYTGVYRDTNGPGEEHTIKMAIQDFNGGKVLGRPIELLTADNLNKTDVATDIAKRWLDVEKIDMLVPSGSSAAALAAHGLARDRGIVTNVTASAAVNFTEQDCSPLGFHWQMDSYAFPRATVIASGEMARRKWFFVSLDNVFGNTSTAACAAAVQEAGGQVVGTVRHPINTTDFASFIAQAQASRADMVSFVSAGTDLIRALKQAREFGIWAGGQAVCAPILQFYDIQAAGLAVVQDMRCADSYYWNANDATRAFAKRFQDQTGRAPAATFAQVYAAVTHYLQAVEAARSTEGKAVAARMRAQPITTPFWRNTSIRPNGRVVYDLTVMRLKGPGESRGKYDVAEVAGSIPGEKAFKPQAATECRLV